MSKKTDIQAELTKLEIPFDPAAKIADLEALLPDGNTVKNEPEDSDEFQVIDPEAIVPKVLPNLINPPQGQDWKNNEQAEYAKILNAAAYCRPESWTRLQKGTDGKEIPNSAPKHVELARLKEIGENPSRFYVYTGQSETLNQHLKFNNKAAPNELAQ